MTVIAEPPRETFRVDMLWNDARYRSTFIQAVALILVLTAVGWIVNNVIGNLARLGKDFNFAFLAAPASYDINQTLIEYTSRSTHARAALVGILNTLLIAVMGCAAATLIGVVAGVLRLSKNWLVARLMTVFVEGFRNVPLLIWILMVMGAVNESLPAPRGATPTLGGALVATNRGVYIPAPVWGAGSWSVVAAFLLSLVGIWFWRRHARLKQEATGEQSPVLAVSLALFFLPALVVYFVAGMPITLEFPTLQGFNYRGGIFMRDSLVALWLALSFYTGAFIAEIVRGGILAVSHGQSEAAFALGLRKGMVLRFVVLPQALRIIIPPTTSQYLNLTKNSSLAVAIGYPDLVSVGNTTLNQTGQAIEGIAIIMAVYLTLSLSISLFMNWYNKKIALVDR